MGNKVLFVGTNPSTKSPDNSAMHPSTKSRKTLNTWISDLDIDAYFCNVLDRATENNKPLSKKQILVSCKDLIVKIEKFKCSYVVALGEIASHALDHASIKHLKIPHPSGLNRKLNNKETVYVIRKNLREMIEGKNNIEIR